MTWTLKSGRELDVSARELSLDPDGAVRYGYDERVLDDEGERIAMVVTEAERREIAEAVKACWDRWAETGEP